MLLVIDAGNTNIKVGVFDGRDLKRTWRLAADARRTSDEYGVAFHGLFDAADIEPLAITGIAVSSVVPQLDLTLAKMAELYFAARVLFVSASNSGMPVRYENPDEIGPDRIVNAVAAFERLGGPCIAVDLGTATTFEAVSDRGEYLGGVICPGVETAAEALFRRGARLGRVEIKQPGAVIGTNTKASMQSGLYYGNLALIDGIIDRIIPEIGPGARVIATGGLASLFATGSGFIELVDPFLTFEGLRIIHERNTRQ
jgi:type III pantothenate kinase